MRTLVSLAGVWAAGVWAVASAEATVLYDASMNTTPDAQGWVFVTNPLVGPQASQSVTDGVLALNTRPAISEQAGYFSKIPFISYAHPQHPTIDLGVSPFSVQFTMRQVAGSDTPDTDPAAFGQRNRGGFSLLAMSEQLTGIELQFQTDNVVALDNANASFPVGEVQAFGTTDALHDYELTLSTGGYQLFADGSLLLQGSLRDYAGIAPSSPNDFPYTTPSFLFFGDDTGRAEALTELTRLAVVAIPEPAAHWLLCAGAVGAGLWRRGTSSGAPAVPS